MILTTSYVSCVKQLKANRVLQNTRVSLLGEEDTALQISLVAKIKIYFKGLNQHENIKVVNIFALSTTEIMKMHLDFCSSTKVT